MDVTIIGGGVIGLCSAYFLEQEGFDVTVIDKDAITDNCSFGNMGYISPSHFLPLASPGIIKQGLKWMTSSTSPFYIKPRLNIDLLKWGYQFYKNSTAKKVQQNAPHLNNLLQLSRHLIDDIEKEIGGNFSKQNIGCLMLCATEKSLQHEFEMADDAEKFGLKVERLNAEQTQLLEPNSELNVKGSVLFKDDCHFNPGEFMLILKNYLQKKGVNFFLNTEVQNFITDNNKVVAIQTNNTKINCSNVVLACGSWLPLLTKKLNSPLLLQPGKGYSYTYSNIENNINYPAILVDDRCAITPWQNRLRIGGTMELSGINHNILPKRMEGVFHAVKKYYPSLKIEKPPVDKIWCGLRPVSPDGVPYIGKLKKYRNVIVAGGHAMLGLSMASGTGKLVLEILTNKKTSIDIDSFRVNRF